jgi:type III restriction enzyme
MELITYDFQTEAEDALYEQIAAALDSDEKRTEDNETLFLSCVASGKTKMASKTANDIAKDYPDVAFMFFSPSSAQLHDNAYQEIKAYGWDKLDVMTLQEMVIKAEANGGSVPAGSFTAIGWSDINKTKKNVQMKEGEQASFISVMKTNKTRIVAFYDEAHLNKTDNTKQIAELVRPFAVVNITATARKKQLQKAGHLHLVQVDTAKVVAEGKIKAHIIVNDAGMDSEDPEGGLHNDATWEGLIKAGMHRRDWLEQRFRNVGMDTVPLMTIQLPNDDKKENKDDLQTKENAEKAKQMLIDNGADPDDIIIWLAGRHDEDPNNIKNTSHKYLIVKVACATGWNCPRANPLVKLRQPSQSDTLDDQTMGRFMRTVDPWEWQTNEDYQNDEYLNSAFVYTSSEEYDASLQGYSIRDEKYKQTMREDFKDTWKQVHLVKTIPGKKTFEAEDKIVEAMVDSFEKNFPTNYETDGGAWVAYGDLERNVAQVDYDVVEMMNKISESGKASTSGHTQAELSNEQVETYVWEKIRADGSLRRHRDLIKKAINQHINENLYYGLDAPVVDDFLAAPEEDEETRRINKRNDFFKGIYEHFHLFAQACLDAVNEHAEYGKTSVWDGKPGTARPMYTPPVETFTGINLKETPERSTFAYDKQVSKAESNPEERFAVVMDNKMETWFKNGTHEADSFLIAYIDEKANNAHRKFFPDFIGIRERTLYILETKGSFDAQGDHAIKKDQDKCKAKAIKQWENKYKAKSIAESAGVIDDIVFGMVKEINGKWKVYRGDGGDYEDTTSSNWKSWEDIISQ